MVYQRFNFIVQGKSPLGSLPFFFKLVVAIIIDIIGIVYSAAQGIGSAIAILNFPFVAALIPASFTVVAAMVTTGLVLVGIQALVAFLFYSNPMLFPMIAIVELTPVINVFPTMTVMALWNGYKTGWRY